MGDIMKFFGLGMPELIIILIVVLLLFGPKNFPKLGSALGKTVKNLREGMDTGKKEMEETEENVELEVEEPAEVEPVLKKPAPKKSAQKKEKNNQE